MQMRPSQAKQKGLDRLGFIRPNWDFPKRYGDSKQHFSVLPFSTPICGEVLALPADPHALRWPHPFGTSLPAIPLFRKELSKNLSASSARARP
jgi:hypothetical protein